MRWCRYCSNLIYNCIMPTAFQTTLSTKTILRNNELLPFWSNFKIDINEIIEHLILLCTLTYRHGVITLSSSSALWLWVIRTYRLLSEFIIKVS